MLTIWGRKSSSNVQKVMWLVAELGVPYQHIPAGGPYGKIDEPSYRAMNPNGLVPVIDDDGTIVCESNAILRYIASAYGAPRLWPEEPRARAAFDQWMDWVATTLQPDFIGLFYAYWRTPEDQRDQELIATLTEKSRQRFQFLDAQLAGRPYLLGDEFSLADIANGVHLYRLFTLEIFRDVRLPHIEAWYQRLQQRPAYRQHVMVAYDELKGRLSF